MEADAFAGGEPDDPHPHAVAFRNQRRADTTVIVLPFRPAAPAGLFSAGFTNLLSVEGSGWTNKALSLSVGTLIISNAAIDSSYAISIISNTVVKEPGTLTNSLTGTVNPKTGLLRVTFGTGVGSATLAGACAILQDSTVGGGYFVTKTNAGLIWLQP